MRHENVFFQYTQCNPYEAGRCYIVFCQNSMLDLRVSFYHLRKSDEGATTGLMYDSVSPNGKQIFMMLSACLTISHVGYFPTTRSEFTSIDRLRGEFMSAV